jgi:hypothetical protein
VGTKPGRSEDNVKLFSIGNVLAFQDIQLDETLAGVLFALGPGNTMRKLISFCFKNTTLILFWLKICF